MAEDKNENLLNPEKINKTDVGQKDKGEKHKLDKEVSKKDKQIEDLLNRVVRLEKTANKKRLDGYDRLNQEDSETTYRLRMIDGKVIIRWSDLITNKAEVNPITRKVEEDQRLTVYYEDGEEETMTLVVFNRRYKHFYTTLVEEKILRKPEEKKKYGDRILTVETVEGKRYEIGDKFVN